MKKVMLVVIAALLTIVAIQFVSTASSTPTRQAVSLPKRVTKLEKQVKALNKSVSAIGGIMGCLVSQPVVPITRFTFTAPTAGPSGGYLDNTPSGGTPSFIVFQIDPKCLGSANGKLKPQFRLNTR